jgi:hypothetical protein
MESPVPYSPISISNEPPALFKDILEGLWTASTSLIRNAGSSTGTKQPKGLPGTKLRKF